jgi:hypothetical protein
MEIRKPNQKGLIIRWKGAGIGVNLFPKLGDLKGQRLDLSMILYTNGEAGREEDFDGLKIMGPGEYESRGVAVRGWYVNPSDQEEKKSSVYLLDIEGLIVCVMGKIKEPLADQLVEEIGVVDILSLDLGSEVGMDKLWEQVKKMAPNMVIPVNFANDKEEKVKNFLDAADQEAVKSVEKIRVDGSTLPEDRVVVILNGHK